MINRVFTLVCMLLALHSTNALAGSFSVRAGPQQLGNGGSYPMWWPPIGLDQYAFTWVTNGNFETTVSIYPGLLFGKRFQHKGVFVSLGGGFVLDSLLGMGIYSTFGYETGSGSTGWHFTCDYTQVLGREFDSPNKYQAPSSARIGALWRY